MIEQHKTALAQKVCVLCELEEIVTLLEQEKDLKMLLRRKSQIAVTEKPTPAYATPRPQPAPSKPDNSVRASAVPPESVSATAPKMRVVFVR